MGPLPEIEGFRLTEEIGSGALTSVYAAIDLSLERKVALKVLKATVATGSPFAAQVEREARILAELSHPNIGQLYALRMTPRPTLVMELVDGLSLSTLLKRKPLPPGCVPAIGAAIARALAHAHDHGVVHRDVKPANVIIGRDGTVKLLDFGIAQPLHAQGEPPRPAPIGFEGATSFGTPAYMSPEQILGEPVDGRSDVFSLGVVLYQLVCGARPFERGEGDALRPAAHRIRRDPPIPLHRRAPDVAPALERVIMRAIEKTPADRFATAAGLAERLEELAGPACGLPGDHRIVRALEHAGVARAREPAPGTVPARHSRGSLREAWVGLAVIGACCVAGAVVLQNGTRHAREGTPTRELELVPAAPGFLRVLATPWAEVWVDGQRIDVTPFARAIPLPSGTHYVTLTHPSAPAERRVIALAPGETRTIDAVMAVMEAPAHEEPQSEQSGAARGHP